MHMRKLRFRGSNLMFGMMFIAMMVSCSGYDSATYIKIMAMLGIIDTIWAVTLPSIVGATCPGLAGAFGIFSDEAVFSVPSPRKLNEAASIDGAGVFAYFSQRHSSRGPVRCLHHWRLLCFTYAWNDYFHIVHYD